MTVVGKTTALRDDDVHILIPEPVDVLHGKGGLRLQMELMLLSNWI